MTIMTIIGSGVSSAVVSFAPTALAAGVVLGGLLLVTATVVRRRRRLHRGMNAGASRQRA
jgi:uncharacterized membrane protein YfcA